MSQIVVLDIFQDECMAGLAGAEALAWLGFLRITWVLDE
ncbi:hypothetical protein P303_06200 [Xylella fastidiosa MUL0034]|nr:hypothetical protein P303_06200 [Xylella fastidiosa MUL0034]